MNDKFNRGRPVRAEPLLGKTAAVTGASSGIGKAIAFQLAADGANVIVHTRTRYDAAEQVCAAIRALGRDATCLLADLAQPEEISGLAERAWNWQSGVDVWVNNAGADVLTGPEAEWPFEKKLDYLWRVDVVATIQLSRAIGRRMVKRGGAAGAHALLNIGWDQIEYGMRGDSGELFTAIKGAVTAFSRSLAKSLAPQVRVNCLAPGWIQTAWGSAASEYWQERARRESLLERWGTPDDVAQAASFLVSPASGFITGQVLAVNGGFRHGQETAAR